MINYDKNKVGKMIGRGIDRKVYLYGDKQVIKMSTLGRIFGRKLSYKLATDYSVCKTYLKEYVVDTFRISSNTSYQIVELQQRIIGRTLIKDDLKDPFIKGQLSSILEIIVKMNLDGYSTLDLIGHKGMLGGYLSNIILDEDKNLKIIDISLVEGKSLMPIGVIIELLKPIIILRQKLIIKKLLSN